MSDATKRLRELSEAALGPDWQACYWPLPEPTHHVMQADPDPFSSRSGPAVCGPCASEADADLIAEARNALPFLLDVCEAADRTVDQHYRTASGSMVGKEPLWAALEDLRQALAALSSPPDRQETM